MTPPRNPWPGALIAVGVGFCAVLTLTMFYGIGHHSAVVAPSHATRAPGTPAHGVNPGWLLSPTYRQGVLTVRVSGRSGSPVAGARVAVRLLDARGLPGAPHPLCEAAPGTYAAPVPVPEGGVRARLRAERGNESRSTPLFMAR